MFSNRLFRKSKNQIQIVCEEPSKIDDVCSICLDGFDSTKHLFTTQCGHKFHTPCFEQACKTHHLCPNCRAPIQRVTLNIKIERSHSRRNHNVEEECIQWIDYCFKHHFLITLIFAIPFGYTYLIGCLFYITGKMITYPIWINWVRRQQIAPIDFD